MKKVCFSRQRQNLVTCGTWALTEFSPVGALRAGHRLTSSKKILSPGEILPFNELGLLMVHLGHCRS